MGSSSTGRRKPNFFRRDILSGISRRITYFHRLKTERILRQYGYALCKSFRRDILDGYLENSVFVFMDLREKIEIVDMKW